MKLKLSLIAAVLCATIFAVPALAVPDYGSGAGNPGDPVLDQILPLENDVVRGSFYLVPRAYDDGSVVSAEFSGDGGATWLPMSPSTAGEWFGLVDVRGYENGAHVFQVRVTDDEGNSVEGSRSLMIDNDDAPNPVFSSPVPGSRITSSPTTITVTTEDRVDQVAIYGDDNYFLGLASVANAERTLWSFTTDFSGLPDQQDFSLHAYTGNSHSAAHIDATYELDLVPGAPTPSFVSPAAQQRLEGDFAVEFTTSEFADITQLYAIQGEREEWVATPAYDAASRSWKTTINLSGWDDDQLTLRAIASNSISTETTDLTVISDNVDGSPQPSFVSPAADATVDGSFLVEVVTSQPAQVIEIWSADLQSYFGQASYNFHNSRWELTVDASSLPEGELTLRALARNDEGELSADLTVVNNSRHTNPPTWLGPLEGTELSGNAFLLQARSSVEVDAVDFFLDGELVGHATEDGGADTNDWRLNLDTSDYTIGDHVLSAVSYENGEASVPAEINVTIADVESPFVSNILPAASTTVEGDFELSFSASDNVAVTSGEFSTDEGESWLPMNEVGAGEFAVTLNVDEYLDGQYVIFLRATDAAGNVSNVGDEQTSIVVDHPVAASLDTSELWWSGTTKVGSTLSAGGASATGNPEPTLDYRWQVCPEAGSCTNYSGSSYSPLASEVGFTVELHVTAANGVGSSDTEISRIGTVTASPVVEEPPAPTPTPTLTPAPAPAPAPTSAPLVDVPAPALSGRTIWGVPANPAKQVIVAADLDDVIRTGAAADVIRSYGGNDRIFPGRGRDFVYAGSGNDVIWAQHGRATVYCGLGVDRVYANRFVRTFGCETVIVASNNHWAKVKLNGKAFPIMPKTFVRPYFQG